MTEAEWFAAADPAPLLRHVESRFTDRLRLLFMAGCCRRICNLLTDERFRRVVEVAEDVVDGNATQLELQAASEELPRPGPRVPPRRGQPTGVLNFHDLPSWCQQTYHAIAAIALRNFLIVAERCENAAAHHAGDEVAEHHLLHEEIRRLREDVQKAHHKAEDYRFRGARTLHEQVVAAARSLERETEKQIQTLTNEIWSANASERIRRSQEERAAQTDLVRCLIGNPFGDVAIDPAWLTSTVVALARGIGADRAFDRLPILADALEDAGCADPNVLSHCRGEYAHTRGCWVIESLTAT